MRLNPFRARAPAPPAKALLASPAVLERLGAGEITSYPLIATPAGRAEIRAHHVQTQAASYGFLYKKQPAVRIVVDYLARNVAPLPIKLYERKSDTDRVERWDHPAAATIRTPSRTRTRQRFIYGMVSDFAVYDNAYALKFPGTNGRPVSLVKVPPHAVGIIGDNLFSPEGYRIYRADGTFFDAVPDEIIHWAGYDPDDERLGFSKLETLRLTLAEEAASQQASVELMKSGLAQVGHIERPLEAAEWSDTARDRFEEGWANRSKDRTKNPVLEEGMEFKPASVSPKDAEMLAGRQFTLDTVAGIYGLDNVPPEDEDERKQAYADVFAPLLDDLTAVLNAQLLDVDFSAGALYYEFDLGQKLAGDMAELYKTLVSAAGAPILTRDEARAEVNLPDIDGGDELITPLNVVVGDKPSTVPMPPQDPLGPSQEGDERKRLELERKAIETGQRAAMRRRRDGYAAEFAALIRSWLRRQEDSIKSRRAIAAKAAADERWRNELADDLHELSKRTVANEGAVVARRLASEFNVDQTDRYLRVMAEGRASDITTALAAALSEPDAVAADVFKAARDVSAQSAGATLGTFVSSFAGREAGKQSDEPRVKTWIVTSSNSSHPEMDGETVPIAGVFSNGEDGPPSSDHPGCQCLLEIS